jgi:eukaryotic-like serine/threonine-protein kinase
MSEQQPGALLAGRYRLQGVIGRGGMGEVWRAVDEQLHRDVAVKLLAASAVRSPETEERFRREALAVARLNQRRVAGLFDYVQADGVSFIVMELLDGESLAQRVAREGALPPTEAAEIVGQAAEGLQAAHDAGITHRDIKPANIMLTMHGVKLLDFGLAATAWDAALTSTGMMVGTLAYLSPERAEGTPGTAAGDIYALGVVLYEALAGRPPFRADNPLALIHAQAEGPPELPANTPPWLADVCLRALAPSPADRFPSATAFATAVRGHAATLPTPPPGDPSFAPTTVMQQPASGGGRKRRVGHWPALLGIVAVAAIVTAILIWPRGGDEPTDTGQHAQSTATGGAQKDKHKDNPKHTAVAAAMRGLHEDLADLAKSGDVKPDAAKTINETVKQARKQLNNKRDADEADKAIDTVNGRIDALAKEGTVSAKAADALHADIKEIADAAGHTS